MLKSLYQSALVARVLGTLLASWIKLIRATGRFHFEPEGAVDHYRDDLPFIAAMWHGQHFVVPLSMFAGVRTAVMISRSADGEIQAIAGEMLGLEPIRASGAQKKHQISKRGGAVGFIQALRTLRDGVIVAITCDIPKGPARVCGEGIVQLAAKSGRPIVPIAVATSRRITLQKSWDRAVINLPFSRVAVIYGDPITVPANAENLEPYRLAIQTEMNRVTDRAYDIVDRRTHAR